MILLHAVLEIGGSESDSQLLVPGYATELSPGSQRYLEEWPSHGGLRSSPCCVISRNPPSGPTESTGG